MEQYKKLIFNKIFLIIGLFLSIIFFLLVSLKIGDYNVSIYKIILGDIDERFKFVLINLRLTRVIGAIIVGAALGISGAVQQNVLRNPLASPFTLGVSQGAAFGAAFAIILLNSKFIIPSAFVFSMFSVIAILLLSSISEITSESLILAGVALSSFFGAATMLLKYFATDIQVASAVFWTFGDLSKATWSNISIMLLFFIPSLLFFLLNSWNYNAILWGEETAKSLGVNVKRLTILTLIISSLICSVTISFLGIIGFVGLIAPHIMRIFIGSDYRFLIPLSALNGSLIMLLADIISKTVLSPVIIPVGIVTSFAGAPLFLYILIRNKR